MPIYPVHPCCYCRSDCQTPKKVRCAKFLTYIQKLCSMSEKRVLIQELKYLITNQAPRQSSGQGGQ